MAAAVEKPGDRIGIGWRPELAAGILAHLDHIDVVEVMAEDLFSSSARGLRAMETLAAQVPVVLHGVSLGLASTHPVDTQLLDRMARVVERVRPDYWSEHLAFVRAEGHEIGHLAAPPRTTATVDGTARNVETATRVIGGAPLLENVATLIDPPGSAFDEAVWLTKVFDATRSSLLLDLNNLHTNATNFGFDATAFLERIPLDRAQAVHLAGGKWVNASTGERRMLDDHLHDVPDAVYGLLTRLGALAPQPLTVILERDGAYPTFDRLRVEIERAREALARGRLAPAHGEIARQPSAQVEGPGGGGPVLEAYLARLYVDPDARARFLADPPNEARLAGLDGPACEALARMDRVGLELAARSFARKRAGEKY